MTHLWRWYGLVICTRLLSRLLTLFLLFFFCRLTEDFLSAFTTGTTQRRLVLSCIYNMYMYMYMLMVSTLTCDFSQQIWVEQQNKSKHYFLFFSCIGVPGTCLPLVCIPAVSLAHIVPTRCCLESRLISSVSQRNGTYKGLCGL